MNMDARTHWEKIYTTKAPDQVSWYRPHLETSLGLVLRAVSDRAASIVDVGGGESTLVDDLLQEGFQNITVLDVSQAAIDVNKARLGEKASSVRWLVADVTQVQLQVSAYDLWHDRAVFHFLTAKEQRTAYVRQVIQRGRRNAAGWRLCATTPNLCTRSLAHVSAWSKVQRKFIRHLLVQRSSFCIATAEWSSSGPIFSR
jgi:ubiquinone/menaquinone biosynthesis C-methylase UbiE